MDYRLENLSEDDFESLINMLCQNVLGIGFVSFSKGKDGGRDGRFEGVANAYPSKTEQWKGKFIIQVKHTTDYQASCSDNKFFGNKTGLVEKEVPKVKVLKSKGEIDNYLLFTNRKETESREEARQYIKDQTGLTNVDIIGKDTLHRFLSQNKEIVKQFGLDRFTMPFEFYDKDIKELIVIFHDTILRTTTSSSTLDRPSIEEKNQINNLDNAYYENIILPDLDRYENQILAFLQNPINVEYAQYYEETSSDLKRIIEANREQFDDFKKIFSFLTNYLMEKEPDKLKKYRNTIPAFFHFMYYQCDIGRNR
ncbi:ABC-three component system protein [Flectobacillus longus]|uniref:ABC-three component system protein n=1 Tax=Flectobacillus longus TaxID=2984207 RepID=UPI0024B65FE4|nr:ABC-three component system protein [Flectobacillus longus]MDI9881453.1 hypothetical protein [Flectobacillus longus]